jgi:CBS domain containing-hemolysin-like protein
MNYKKLQPHLLKKNVSLCVPTEIHFRRVENGSPALEVMTDLEKQRAITIAPDTTIDQAHQKMIQRNIHMLFVLGKSNSITGIITTEDVLGEKPVQFMQKHRIKRDKVLVEDLMTPRKKLEALDYIDIKKARVGDIVRTLKAAKRVHALVLDYQKSDEETSVIKGIFSLNQISRQLGMELYIYDIDRINGLS